MPILLIFFLFLILSLDLKKKLLLRKTDQILAYLSRQVNVKLCTRIVKDNNNKY